MPRQPRLILPDVPVHIIQRGNNRQACFYADDDYLFYLDHLAKQSEKAGCAIHAYCLMTNHVHLLLTPRNAESRIKGSDSKQDQGVRLLDPWIKGSDSLILGSRGQTP